MTMFGPGREAVRARSTLAVVLGLFLAGASGPAGAGAGAAQENRTTVWDGVYTVEQASRGEAVYRNQCSSCHQADFSGTEEASPLSGDAFMQAWREDTVGNLYTRVRNLMPFDEPASLSDDAYLDSVAYLLQANGFPPGPRELTAAGAADVRIETEDGPGAVPSFALVQVVGCLARDDAAWVLTRATRAVRTTDPSESSPEALRRPRAAAPRNPDVRAHGRLSRPRRPRGAHDGSEGVPDPVPGRRPDQRQHPRDGRRRVRSLRSAGGVYLGLVRGGYRDRMERDVRRRVGGWARRCVRLPHAGELRAAVAVARTRKGPPTLACDSPRTACVEVACRDAGATAPELPSSTVRPPASPPPRC